MGTFLRQSEVFNIKELLIFKKKQEYSFVFNLFFKIYPVITVILQFPFISLPFFEDL